MPKPTRISTISQWFDERLEKIGLPRAFAVCSLAQRLLYNAGEEGDGYLDQIELVVSPLPSFGSAGFIYDVGVSRIQKLVGIEEGVIYLPADTPQVGYMPGYTLALMRGGTLVAKISMELPRCGIASSERSSCLSMQQPGSVRTLLRRLCISCAIAGVLTDLGIGPECIES